MTAQTVLTVGSLHYDIMVEADHLPRRDETAVGTRWFPKFGGKGGNQAVAVAKAGMQRQSRWSSSCSSPRSSSRSIHLRSRASPTRSIAGSTPRARDEDRDLARIFVTDLAPHAASMRAVALPCSASSATCGRVGREPA